MEVWKKVKHKLIKKEFENIKEVPKQPLFGNSSKWDQSTVCVEYMKGILNLLIANGCFCINNLWDISKQAWKQVKQIEIKMKKNSTLDIWGTYSKPSCGTPRLCNLTMMIGLTP
jgi:hypothetical protein